MLPVAGDDDLRVRLEAGSERRRDGGAGIDHEGLGRVAARDDEAVEGAGTAVDEVVAVVADLEAEERGDAPGDRIIASPGEDHVVALAAGEGAVAAVADQDVIAVVAVDRHQSCRG